MVVFGLIFMAIGGIFIGGPSAWIAYGLGKEAEASKHRPESEWTKTKSVTYKTEENKEEKQKNK